MNALVPLHFDRFDIRVIMRGNVPWWVAADVADVLGFHSAATMVRSLDEDEKGYADLHTLGGQQKMIIISLSGLLACALRSSSERTKPFRKWVTGEVIPSIFRHGTYPPPPEPEFIALPAPLPVVETRQGRFLQECERLAAQLGEPMEKLFEHIVSPAQFKAMAKGGGDLDKLLTREMRWVGFMNMGMDLPYVLTGNRSLMQ